VRELHPTGIFAAVGRFDYRFRRWLPIVGLAIVIGTNVWAAASGGTLIQGGWVIDGSEEQRAAALIADRFGSEATTMLVVYRDPKGTAAAPAFQATVGGQPGACRGRPRGHQESRPTAVPARPRC